MSTAGPYDVVLHLATPNTALSFGLVNERIMSPAQLANLGSSFGNDPVCVGPFMFQSDVPGQSVTVVRSPYYYDKQDVHLDKIVFTAETSDLAAASALEAGDVQALDQVPQDVLKSVEQNGFRVLGHLSIGSISSRSTSATRTGSTARTRARARRSPRAPCSARRSRWRSTARP